MKKLKAFISWLIFNTLLVVSVWFGVVNGNSNWANVASFVVWLFAISGMLIWFTKEVDEIKEELRKSLIPGIPSISIIIDILVLFALVYNGWIIHSIVFLFYMLFDSALRNIRKKLIAEDKLKKVEDIVNA